ncbi:Zn(2)-C6 fungal-type domain-containing protein [Trichoderma simmonsii]|nr:Zn(2)-C6 fungal-type domain-containing protein [Trichoderma simmonsii]
MPDSVKPGRSPHLQKAIQVLPPRSCVDALVDNFLDFVNFRYYIVHPVMFRREYQHWCSHAYTDNHVELQWTALLLMVCACSAQYPSDALHRAFKAEQSQPIHQLSEKYHETGRKLATRIPMGRYDIHAIQTYLHSSLFFKTRARYSECRRDLAAAVQIASKMNISHEETTSPLFDYNMEMGSRAWVIMCAWDWQLGNMTSHPLILQSNLYYAKSPGTLLDEELKEPYPSPGLFMSLQSELGSALLQSFERLELLEEMEDVRKYSNIVESWATRLPPHFSLRDPDTSLDEDYPWLRFQRFSLTMMATLSLLSPLRYFLIIPLSTGSLAEYLQLQSDGTLWALRHLNRLFQFLRFAFPGDATYHTILFFIFDVSVLLCSAMIHDIDSSMPLRELALKAVDGSLCVMRTLEHHAPIPKHSYKILNRIYEKALRPMTTDDTHRVKRRRLDHLPDRVFPNRRVEHMPELDEFWDNYDYSFTGPGENGPISHITADDDVVVTSSANTPSSSMLTDEPPTPLQYDEENAEIVEMLSACIRSSNLDDRSTAITPSNALMHHVIKSVPEPIEHSDNSETTFSAHDAIGFEHLIRYLNDGVCDRLWGLDRLE